MRASRSALVSLIALAASAGSSVCLAHGEGYDEKKNQKAVSNIWWNNPRLVEQLALTAEQRGKMDHLLIDNLNPRESDQNEMRSLWNEFSAAMSNGQYESADIFRQRIVDQGSDAVDSQLSLMIATVKVLSDKQREQLLKERPRIFSALWIREATPGAMLKNTRRQKPDRSE